MTSSLLASPASDLLAFAGGQGHAEHPCLSRTHAPASCVPCVDFSPWLRERLLQQDSEAVAEYLFRVREANPGLGEGPDQLRAHYGRLAHSLTTAPLDRYLDGGDESAYLDLRATLVLLAVHEGFSGFIMTGDASEFLASVMAPYAFSIRDGGALVEARNRFVLNMGQEMSYWAAWPMLEPSSLRFLGPPREPALEALLATLRTLPLGSRAHAVDVIRHLSAHPHIPRTLASLSRYETRKRGLDVAVSSRLVQASGIVEPATDLDGWLGTWTRRDLLGFLAQSGVGARNSWGKERLTEAAKTQCGHLLRARMADAGVVELAPGYVEGARLLKEHVESARESWRVWIAFGTGVS